MIHTLLSHWENLRTDGALPLRSDINPCKIPEVLDALFILEQLNPTDIRVRIAGLTLCEMMGMEVRGQSPLSFFSTDARQRMSAVIADVMQRPTIARLGLDTQDKMGNKARAEMILLPLRGYYGDVNRIIGCVTPPEKGFTAPIWFRIRTVDMKPVVGDPATGRAQPRICGNAKRVHYGRHVSI